MKVLLQVGFLAVAMSWRFEPGSCHLITIQRLPCIAFLIPFLHQKKMLNQTLFIVWEATGARMSVAYKTCISDILIKC